MAKNRVNYGVRKLQRQQFLSTAHIMKNLNTSFYNASYGGRIFGVVCGIYGVGYFHYSLLFFLLAVICGVLVDTFVMYVYAPRRQRRLFRQNLSADLVSLCAKMCKAKGVVEKSDIATCNRFFDIPKSKGDVVSEVFNRARTSVQGYEAIAQRISRSVGGNRAELENLLKILYAIAHTDGRIDEKERIFLLRVADVFGFSPTKIAAIEHEVGVGDGAEQSYGNLNSGSVGEWHYKALGLNSGASMAEVKKAYRKLVAVHHPDRVRSAGLSDQDAKKAEEKMANINAAYNAIVKK